MSHSPGGALDRELGSGLRLARLVAALADRAELRWVDRAGAAGYTQAMQPLVRAAGWTLLLAACHREPKRALTKADLEEARALRFVPFSSVGDVRKKLGAPSRVDQNRSVWTAQEGSQCWDLTIISGGGSALFWLDQRRCDRGR